MSENSSPTLNEDDVRPLMLAIKTLDNWASISLSEHTGRWYISAKIQISNGNFLKAVTEHRDTPAQAVRAFVDALKELSMDEVIVASPTGERRHYRWNGAAFAEQYDQRLAALKDKEKCHDPR